jgi:hypothetical protein
MAFVLVDSLYGDANGGIHGELFRGKNENDKKEWSVCSYTE